MYEKTTNYIFILFIFLAFILVSSCASNRRGVISNNGISTNGIREQVRELEKKHQRDGEISEDITRATSELGETLSSIGTELDRQGTYYQQIKRILEDIRKQYQ